MPRYTPSQPSYGAKVEACIGHMLIGDTYELCLTAQHTGEIRLDNVARPADDDTELPDCPTFDLFYTRLQVLNPAPYGCFIEVSHLDGFISHLDTKASHLEGGYCGHLSRAVLSSSPERCIKITAQGMVEMKPIKGTLKIGS